MNEPRTKFTAQEILDSLNMELDQLDIDEIYKGLVAYSLGLQEITESDENKLRSVINFYHDSPEIAGIVNQDVMNYAENIFED